MDETPKPTFIGHGDARMPAFEAGYKHELPATATTLFRASHEFLRAAVALDPTAIPTPFAAVSAHCLELALKSYLMKRLDLSEAQVIRGLGHNIQRAWNECIRAGLPLADPMPTWVLDLAGGHNSPYLFRYPKDQSGIALSPKSTIIEGLGEVLAKVQESTGVQ